MRVIKVNDTYAASSANAYRPDMTQVRQYIDGVNMSLGIELTDAGRAFQNNVNMVSQYLQSDAILNDIDEVKRQTFEITTDIEMYDEENYMHINPYMQEVVMCNPYLYNEYEGGDIAGFGKDKGEYDDILYTSLVGGVADEFNDCAIFADSDDSDTGMDRYERVLDVWSFYVNALVEDDDDFTDI
jgi:hypothetical protein